MNRMNVYNFETSTETKRNKKKIIDAKEIQEWRQKENR
jgi:hypothetical protein